MGKYTSFAKDVALLIVALFIGIWGGNFISGYFGLGSVPMPSLGIPLVVAAILILVVHGYLKKKV